MYLCLLLSFVFLLSREMGVAVDSAVLNGTQDDIIMKELAIAAHSVLQAYHFRICTSSWLMSKRTVSLVIHIPTLMAPHNAPIFQNLHTEHFSSWFIYTVQSHGSRNLNFLAGFHGVNFSP
jgi:hypothetical protein